MAYPGSSRKFLYHGWAVDPTILTTIYLFAYISQCETKILFRQYTAPYRVGCSMFSFTRSQKQSIGTFYLTANTNLTKVHPKCFNAPLHTECRTTKNVVSSTTEAECAALFHNCTVVVGIWHALEGLCHPQTHTRVIANYSTANSFVHSEMRVKRSKSWDMRYNWLRDRIAQVHFHVKWKEGIHNLADYFTKHHLPKHDQIKRYDNIIKGFLAHFSKQQ